MCVYGCSLVRRALQFWSLYGWNQVRFSSLRQKRSGQICWTRSYPFRNNPKKPTTRLNWVENYCIVHNKPMKGFVSLPYQLGGPTDLWLWSKITIHNHYPLFIMPLTSLITVGRILFIPPCASTSTHWPCLDSACGIPTLFSWANLNLWFSAHNAQEYHDMKSKSNMFLLLPSPNYPCFVVSWSCHVCHW